MNTKLGIVAPLILAAVFTAACTPNPYEAPPSPEAETTAVIPSGKPTFQEMHQADFTWHLQEGFHKLTFRGDKVDRDQNLSCLAVAYHTGGKSGLFAMSCDYDHPGAPLKAGQDFSDQQLTTKDQLYPLHSGLHTATVPATMWGGNKDVKCTAIATSTGSQAGLFSMSCKF